MCNVNVGVYLSDVLLLMLYWMLMLLGCYDWLKVWIGDESGV